MKKLAALLIMLSLMLSAMLSVAFAEGSVLIEDAQLSLSTIAVPNKLEVIFNLSEAIDLSQENTNIIIEYLGENLETTNYIKDKSWSGYLNSYENYPSGEQKYSSGYTNESYPDIVPAVKIYTSTKTGSKIDVTKVSAVKITALRADGSGEEITVGIDGNILSLEEVVPTNGEEIDNPPDETIPPITEVENPPYETAPPAAEQNLGIKINSETAILPPNTTLVAEKLSSGSVYDSVSLLLADAINFIAIDIKLESNGQTVQPGGKVNISIPIPESFSSSNLAVYRIDDDGGKIPYVVTITTNEETKYATFLTDHFSTYVLVEERPPQEQKDNNQNQNAQLRGERRPIKGIEIKENKPSETIEIEENRTPLAGEMTETEENRTPLEGEMTGTKKNRIPATGLPQTRNYIITITSIIGLLVFINIKKVNHTNQK